MKKDNGNPSRPSTGNVWRRTFIKAPLVAAAAIAAPSLLIGKAHAAGKYMNLESIKAANINWRMAKGAKITVGASPPATSRTSRPS